MISFPEKAPSAIINYELTFVGELSRLAPLTIVGLSWSIISPPADLTPVTIVEHQEPSDNSSSIVRLAGGSSGKTYRAECLLTFSDGQVCPVSFLLPIAPT